MVWKLGFVCLTFFKIEWRDLNLYSPSFATRNHNSYNGLFLTVNFAKNYPFNENLMGSLDFSNNKKKQRKSPVESQSELNYTSKEH